MSWMESEPSIAMAAPATVSDAYQVATGPAEAEEMEDSEGEDLNAPGALARRLATAFAGAGIGDGSPFVLCSAQLEAIVQEELRGTAPQIAAFGRIRPGRAIRQAPFVTASTEDAASAAAVGLTAGAEARLPPTASVPALGIGAT